MYCSINKQNNAPPASKLIKRSHLPLINFIPLAYAAKTNYTLLHIIKHKKMWLQPIDNFCTFALHK